MNNMSDARSTKRLTEDQKQLVEQFAKSIQRGMIRLACHVSAKPVATLRARGYGDDDIEQIAWVGVCNAAIWYSPDIASQSGFPGYATTMIHYMICRELEHGNAEKRKCVKVSGDDVGDNEKTMWDVLGVSGRHSTQADVEAKLHCEDLRDILDAAIDGIRSDRDKQIIRRLYGLYDGVLWPASEVAKVYGLSVPRVNQIRQRELKKLRHAIESTMRVDELIA